MAIPLAWTARTHGRHSARSEGKYGGEHEVRGNWGIRTISEQSTRRASFSCGLASSNAVASDLALFFTS